MKEEIDITIGGKKIEGVKPVQFEDGARLYKDEDKWVVSPTKNSLIQYIFSEEQAAAILKGAGVKPVYGIKESPVGLTYPFDCPIGFDLKEVGSLLENYNQKAWEKLDTGKEE